MVGEYQILSNDAFEAFSNHQLAQNSAEYKNLRSKHFLLDQSNEIAIDLLALKLRTKLSRLSEFTALHIFVVTLRCEHSCPYCQVSRQSEDKDKYDMSTEIADRAIDLVFKSPSQSIKIEFQGGEPLLNFGIVKYIVKKAQVMNQLHQRNLDFVIATNLAVVTNEILEYCRDNQIHISTSLDGPSDLHDKNRPRKGHDSYERAINGIQLARDILGKDQVSALMTTTEASLKRVKEIVDEYVRRHFNGIFLRHLSPYGFAMKTKSYASYSTERWLDFYKEGLEYIIQLNKNGVEFQEFYASTILKKILTSEESGFVDLMSPAGLGIAAVVYNYNGSVHPSDESRMLAEMGDDKFKLGNVLENTYDEIFGSDALLEPLEDSFAASNPMCTDCAYETYCGAEPVYHYAMHKDFVGRKPESSFCKRNMSIIEYLIERMEDDDCVKKLFQRWANS
jgi:His-Xaa-Ser system radical SAM maturase HxsB